MDLKTKLLKSLAVTPVPFTIKAAGAEVFLRPWYASERQAFQAKVRAAGDGKLPNLYEELFVRTVCDETGTLVFSEEEVEAVKTMLGSALEEVAKETIKLNGLEPDAGKEPAPSPTTPS